MLRSSYVRAWGKDRRRFDWTKWEKWYLSEKRTKKTYSFASGSLYGGGGRGRRGWEETPILFQRGSRSTRSFLGGGAVVFIPNLQFPFWGFFFLGGGEIVNWATIWAILGLLVRHVGPTLTCHGPNRVTSNWSRSSASPHPPLGS